MACNPRGPCGQGGGGGNTTGIPMQCCVLLVVLVGVALVVMVGVGVRVTQLARGQRACGQPSWRPLRGWERADREIVGGLASAGSRQVRPQSSAETRRGLP